MKKQIMVFFLISLFFIQCDRILDEGKNKLKLSGYVLNKVTSEPVENALISIPSENKTETSNEEGFFEFNLEFSSKSNLIVYVSRDSFYTEYFVQEVKPGKDVELENILLEPVEQYTIIKGTLLNSFNNDPISGGEIINNLYDASSYTNNSGNFYITFYTNESQTIALICKSTYFNPETLTVEIKPGYTYDLQNIYLDYTYSPATISGKVIDARADTAVFDVKVTLVDESNVYTNTSSDGNFSLDAQINETGPVSLQLSKYPFSSRVITIDQISPEEEISIGEVTITPPQYAKATFYGYVVNEEGEGIITATITCPQFPSFVATSAASGRFSFNLQVDKTEELVFNFTHNNFMTKSVTVAASPEAIINMENIVLADKYDPAIISGKIVDDRSNEPILGAKVLDSYFGIYTYSDNNGNFALELPVSTPVQLSLAVSKYPYTTKTITIDNVIPTETIDIEVVRLLPPAISPLELTGKLINSDEETIAGVVVTVEEYPEAVASSNEYGLFSINLPVTESSETLHINFAATNNYQAQEMMITVEKETDKYLGNITLEKQYENAVISGTILNQRTGQPIAKAKVLDDETNLFVLSGDDGAFSLELPIYTPTDITLNFSKYPYTSKTRSLDQVTPEEHVDLGSISLTPPAYAPITISGQVLDTDTKLPIENVYVYINEFAELATYSDAYGNFSMVAQVDTVQDIHISISKSDIYNTLNLVKTIEPETDLALGIIEMNSKYDPITITGRVIKYSDGLPLEGVNVSIIEMPEQFTKTNANGQYELSTVITQDYNIHLAFYKAEYISDTAEVAVSPNTDATVSDIPLLEKITKPASIIFISAEPQDIRVKESGGNETSMLTFEVRDSSGIPIDVSEDTTVFVEIISQPPLMGLDDIQASVYPNECRTNSSGRLYTSITAGTVAGPVEVQAYLYTEDGDLVRSKPVALVIHAGHPDQVHFSVAPDVKNIAGLVYSSLTDIVTAVVGDKYGNWVDDGTPVYFTTSGGAIDGYNATTKAEATVVLKTGPNPPLATNGFVTITARTNDKNNNVIETNNLILFSGHSYISDFIVISQASDPQPGYLATLDQGGSATINFTVSDVEFGNPLTSGTTLDVSATPDTLAAVNSTFPEDGLSDIMYGGTEYSLTVVDNPSSISGGAVNIQLKLTSFNGNITRIITVYVKPLPTP
ncbi:MAG: hypothetical protein JXQ65_11835 [Candidatus Marinimicrobia bacterium]|nr:hypothetical protein [Candidatus Neomarinimicrobiota bacterium]